MKFTIKNTRLHDLTVRELNTLIKITIKIGTMKKTVLNAFYHRTSTNNFLLSYAVYRNKKIGWIIVHNTPKEKLLNVCVHPDYRRHGVGTALVAEMKQRSRYKLPLKCLPWNRRSDKFYRNFPEIKPAAGFYFEY